MKRRLIYAVCLGLVLTIVLVTFHNVFSFKYGDGIYSLTSFYQLENDSVDVLVLGSSHAFEDINPMVIWRDTGIAAYDLCGSVSPMWNSYYYLREALKTQHPQLVVLEAYCLTHDIEYIDDSRIIKNVYGMRPSLLKLEALSVSAPKERWLEFGLEYIQYHNRYTDLGAGDYKEYQDNPPYYTTWKGMGNNFETTVYEKPQLKDNTIQYTIPPKQLEYYEKIIDFCNEERIPLLIVASPYPGYNPRDKEIFNMAKDIANDSNIEFINYNDYCDEMGIDWKTDFADDSHLNYRGNVKLSRYLGEYLLDHYNWTSHKTETEKYSSWDQAVIYYENSMADMDLSSITDVNDYGESLSRLSDNYTILIKAYKDIANDDSTEKLNTYFSNNGMSMSETGDSNVWIIDNDGVRSMEKSTYGYSWAKRFGGKELLADDDGIYWNRVNYQKTTEGIDIVVFDEYNQIVADAIGVENNTIIR